MYIKILFSLFILSCNKAKTENPSSVLNTNGKYPPMSKISTKNDNGFLVLKNTYDQKKVLVVYNLDKSKWKSFKFNDNFNDNDIVPFAIKPENVLLVFKCLGKENGFYKIIVNDDKNTEKYIQQSDANFKYQTIEQQILSVFSVDFNEKNNPLKSEPNDTSKKFSKNKDSFYYPVKITGNWLLVEDDNKENFWIKWLDDKGNIIIELFYDA